MDNFKTFVGMMLGLMVLISAVFVFGPPLESKLTPVYSKFRIISIEPYGEGQTRAVFEFTKWRQCAPQGFAWYAGNPGAAFRQIDVEIEQQVGGAPRPLGVQQSSPYILDVAPEDLTGIVFAEIYSRCHFLWTTRTDIYP